jgi:hypothetical protein
MARDSGQASAGNGRPLDVAASMQVQAVTGRAGLGNPTLDAARWLRRDTRVSSSATSGRRKASGCAADLAGLAGQGCRQDWILTPARPSLRPVSSQIHKSACEMKRNLKPFTVEIRKSRTPGQHHQLPPRPLFAPIQVGVAETVQTEEPRVVSQQPAPRRILPSIVEPVWSAPEPVEPVRRRRSSGSKPTRKQMELDPDETRSRQSQEAPAETPVISKGMSQTDAPPVIEEGAGSVQEVQVREAASATAGRRKPRRQASAIAGQVVAREPGAEPALAPETGAVGTSPIVIPRELGHHRPTKRQAAAGQLPRHERWKRRLHPACW